MLYPKKKGSSPYDYGIVVVEDVEVDDDELVDVDVEVEVEDELEVEVEVDVELEVDVEDEVVVQVNWSAESGANSAMIFILLLTQIRLLPRG